MFFFQNKHKRNDFKPVYLLWHNKCLVRFNRIFKLFHAVVPKIWNQKIILFLALLVDSASTLSVTRESDNIIITPVLSVWRLRLYVSRRIKGSSKNAIYLISVLGTHPKKYATEKTIHDRSRWRLLRLNKAANDQWTIKNSHPWEKFDTELSISKKYRKKILIFVIV